MMKWMVAKDISESGDGSIVKIYVRTWHPVYWYHHFRYSYEAATDLSIPFYTWLPRAIKTLFRKDEKILTGEQARVALWHLTGRDTEKDESA